MRALVTGDQGFIGRHFKERLNDDGYDVTGCDLKSGVDCRDVFGAEDRRFDLVVHAAAIVGGREKIDGQPLEVATDLSIDADMFNWAARTRQRRVLYFSSSAAYPIDLQGESGPVRLRESDLDLRIVREPDQSYGWVKVTGEMLAELARAEGVGVTVVRPFSGYGWDQDPTYPFPSFIARGMARSDPFEVWGDGTQVRDFIHVNDVINACLKLIESGTRLPVNLGTGRATSFNELATLVAQEIGYSPTLLHREAKPTGVHWRVADITAMKKFYSPTITLERGIRASIMMRQRFL